MPIFVNQLFLTRVKTFESRLSEAGQFLNVSQIADLVIDWSARGQAFFKLLVFLYTMFGRAVACAGPTPRRPPFLWTDWPVQETLLHAWVEIVRSPAVVSAFRGLQRCRTASGADSPEEVGLRTTFLEKYGAKLRLWLLETCSFSHGARRQRLWQTFLAKFYGVSRMGIMHLSQLGVLTPLTTLDRHWKSLLFTYRSAVRFARTHICGIVVHAY